MRVLTHKEHLSTRSAAPRKRARPTRGQCEVLPQLTLLVSLERRRLKGYGETLLKS